ncbi:MAG: alpha/beta fold hydrolase [Ilumatobacteraceae bacterium]
MTNRIERITFPGSREADLAARLDLPAGPPRAYALFAHCFTCSKDIRAASRIAAVLTDHGFGLLRFDFTGLGASDGEFENTNFSSNVDDLVAAAGWLREHHSAPQVLIGHSLGGAAVVVAASQIPEVAAVATIGAPSDSGHVAALFDGSLDEIAEHGEACVELAGRRFTIRQQLVDDLRNDRVTAAAKAFRGALLVTHSPVDATVGVEHAAALYQAARHPKSFVSLDGADHLLTREADAAYAAAMIGTWADRYVVDQSGAAAAPAASAQVVVAETTQGAFLNHVVTGRHRFLADEPESIGGFDAGPGPYDLLGAALGACTSMTIRMYAERKQMPLARVTVEVSHERVHVDDAAAADDAADHAAGDGKTASARVDRFTRVLHLDGDLDDEQRAGLLRIADRCPVHRTLELSSVIATELA